MPETLPLPRRWGADEPCLVPRSPRYGPTECPAEIDRDALYEQFQPLVASLVRRYGTTPELQQDLPGEIYCRFCRLVAAYDPARGVPICAYTAHMLSQSVFNYVRDHWRYESRHVQVEDEHEWDTLPGAIIEENPEDALLREGIRNRLPRAIARLPQRQRMVLVWRYYDGRSFEEIAAELQIKPATARSLLRHAVAALRVRLTGALD